jgi:hypothetical protein
MSNLNLNLIPKEQKLSEKEFKLFKKWLKSHLAFGPVTVTFTKKDGSERVMECTTSPSLVPVDLTEEKHYTNTSDPVDFPKPKKEKKVSEDAMSVYDLEAKGWRSFRWDSIKQVRFVL